MAQTYIIFEIVKLGTKVQRAKVYSAIEARQEIIEGDRLGLDLVVFNSDGPIERAELQRLAALEEDKFRGVL